MKLVKVALAVAFMGAVLIAAAPFDAQAATKAPPAPAAPGGPCTLPHQMNFVALGMNPDPVHAGTPIRSWQVTIQSDRNGECNAIIEVRDADQFAGLTPQAFSIRPGRHAYTVPAQSGYQFQPGDHCYKIRVEASGGNVEINSPRPFCARLIPPVPAGWTLR